MSIRHTVRRGDSLWALANQYLGSGTKFPQIYDHHNQEVARVGYSRRLFPIEDPNLIYVSQIIIIPGREQTKRTQSAPPAAGTKTEGGNLPLPVNLRVEYTLGRDTPPVRYVEPGIDYTITAEMSGKIAVELLSADRYRHSLELLMSKDPTQVKQKLGEIYDPVLRNLTARPEMIYESGQVKIQTAAQADMGPYSVTVEADAPNHLTGRLTSMPVSHTVDVDGSRYKYSAELEFKVEVTLYSRPSDNIKKTVKVLPPQPKEDLAAYPKDKAIGWQEITTMVTWTIIGTAMILLGCRQLPMASRTTSIIPFRHNIYPNDPLHKGCSSNNA
jgi:LysM repeat protein